MKAELAYGPRRPCPDDVARAHLETFIASFVLKQFRERAHILLIDRVKQRRDAIHSIDRWVDPRYRTALDGQDSFPQVLAQRHGNPQGVYHDVDGSVFLPLDVAATRGNLDHALFTVNADLAFVFEELCVTRIASVPRRRP